MAEPTRLPQALRELEAAIDAEGVYAVLRAVRQRLNEKFHGRGWWEPGGLKMVVVAFWVILGYMI